MLDEFAAEFAVEVRGAIRRESAGERDPCETRPTASRTVDAFSLIYSRVILIEALEKDCTALQVSQSLS